MSDTQDPRPGGPPPAPDTDPVDGRPGLDIQAMLSQLQGMITKVAAASEPTLREVAAKAAELAAVAAERAGPIAHTIAAKTDEVSHTVMERASAYAASMRAKGDAAQEPSGETGDVPDAAASDPPSAPGPWEATPRDGA